MPHQPTKECKRCNSPSRRYIDLLLWGSCPACRQASAGSEPTVEDSPTVAKTQVNLPEPEKEEYTTVLNSENIRPLLDKMNRLYEENWLTPESTKPLSWEKIKEKYSQSGWFDNIRDIKELDKEIANLLLQRDTELREKIEGMKKPRHIEDCTIKHFQADKCVWCIIRMGDYGKAFDEVLKLLPSPGSVEPKEDSLSEAKTQNQLLKEE